MRVIAFLFFAAIMQVSASTNAQKLTYVQKNASLEQLFKEIKKQTGYNIVWYEGKLNPEWSVNANFRKTPLKDVMNIALTGMQLDYTISNKTVVIKEKEMSLMDKLNAAFSNIVVHGRVVDETGAGLQGASVKVKNTNKVTITDVDGHFTLNGVPEKSTLVISYLGYETKEVEASEKMENLQLISGAGKLEEVQINAGYYTVTDKERTGSISKITASTIEKQPINNPLMALQGRVTGLQITQQTGVPGGGFTVQIRGQNSISSGNDPLYIIDGVPYPSMRMSSGTSIIINGTAGANPLSMINPYDIESIEILKDADATAIYGSRGANGVILITTKKGKSGAMIINTGFSYGFSEVGHKIKFLSTPEYIEMRMEAFKNDGTNPTSTDYDVNGIWDRNSDIDWQKELIGNTSNVTNTFLSVSGGNENNRYFLSGNYYSEDVVFPGTFGFKRASLKSSINLLSNNKRFNVVFSNDYSNANSNLPTSDLTGYINLSPNAPAPYDQYGNLNWSNSTFSSNPMALLLRNYKATTNNLIGNVNMSYKILKSLSVKTSIGYNTIKREELSKLPLSSYMPSTDLSSLNRISYFSNNFNNSWQVEPQITYDLKLGVGDLNTLIGASFQESNYEFRSVKTSGFGSDDLMENFSSASTFSSQESNSSQYRYAALFARINYSFDKKYYLNLTARRDGSSRFGPGKKYANFGALGAAWIFSEEKVIKDALPYLNFGKLRFSYGITGNDQILDYSYLQLWQNPPNSTYLGISTLSPLRLANSNYAWETNQKAEGALQLGLFKDKLNIEIVYFRNRSSNQLVGIPLPPSTSFSSVTANLPAIVQNTGWELQANYKILHNKNWDWSTGLNVTIPRNKLISYPELERSTNATKYIVGEPLSIQRYYNTYVDPQTGFYVSEDKDGNGVLNDNDKYLHKFIGQYFYGGLNNSIQFKGLSLDFLISFSKQTGNNYINNMIYAPGYWDTFNPLTNKPNVVISRWQYPGQETNIQKFTRSSNTSYSNARNNGGISIEDSSYLRLKNVSLAYSLPKNWISKVGLNNIEVNLQGQNVFTITKYVGLDPENQTISNLPPLRTLQMGIKATF